MNVRLAQLCWVSLISLPADGSAISSIHEFSIDNVAECESEKENISSSFSNATGASILAAGCEYNRFLVSSDLIITYRSEVAIAPISTYDRSVSALNSQAPYSSLQQCRDGQSAESDLFTRATGLVPFVKYCFTEGSGTSRRYGAGILAIGQPALLPYIASINWASRLGEPANIVFDHLAERLEKAGWSFSYAFGRLKTGRLSVGIRYYSSERFRLTNPWARLGYQNLGECLDARRNFYEALAPLGDYFSHGACNLTLVSEYILDLNWDDRANLQLQPLRMPTSSYHECSAYLSEIRAGLLGEPGFAGVFCAQNDHKQFSPVAIYQLSEPRDRSPLQFLL